MKALVLAAAMFAAISVTDRQASYESGSNPPPDHLANGALAASRVVPLDRDGNPSPNGRIVFLSLGMPHTSPAADPASTLVLLRAGSPSNGSLDRLRDRELSPRGLSEAQVQVAWIRQADDAGAYQLETGLGNTMRSMRARYPNLQIVYLSSPSRLAVQMLVRAQAEQMRVRGVVVSSRAGVLRYPDASPWIAGTHSPLG